MMNFLWIGNELREVCRIGLRSFLLHGHQCRLWCYEQVEAPRGVEVADASSVVPRSVYDKWFGPNAKPPAPGKERIVQAFSDYFRFRLLHDHGGWWCDTDIICIRPFDFPEPYVFSWADWPCDWLPSEFVEKHGVHRAVQSGVLKMPKGSPFLKEILQEIEPAAREADYPFWCGWVKSLTLLLPKYDLLGYLKKQPIFDPLGGSRWKELHYGKVDLPDWAYSVHAYTSNNINEITRGSFLDETRRSQQLL